MKHFILFFISTLFLISCSTTSKKLVEFNLHSDSELVSFSINTTPTILHLYPDNAKKTGSISFKTKDGMEFLSGNPLEFKSSSDQFTGKWMQNDREITISFSKDSNAVVFNFSAKPNDDILNWHINIGAIEKEYFTGLFERTVDGNYDASWQKGITETMNLRGQQVDMFVKANVSLYCPFYISSNGYGLFVDGTWPGKYDFCNSDSALVKISFEGPTFSGRIYSSDNPADLVKAHSLHVGPTILPPKWAFLPWRWRDNHENLNKYYDNTPVKSPYNSQLVEDMLMMEALDIPCGVYWVDRPWAKGFMGYENFEWDKERFPNAVEMIDWLHKKDTRFLLWIAPWVVGDMSIYAKENGYNQPMDYFPWAPDSANGALLDFTNPETRKWWQETAIEKMLKQGVDGFKLDRAEEIVPAAKDIILYNGRTAREVRNDFPVMYVKTVHESCKKIKGDDFMLIPRAGYTGSSKYSGFWAGDIGSPQEGLRASIIAQLRSSVIGFPLWGSDIGGYWHGNLDREVCARWLAFGCFSSLMEFGPTEDRAPWDMKFEPHYDTELIAIWRLYAKLHTQLVDYSYACAKEANETGMPLARPLFLEYPKQAEAWNDWQTFLYGSDILVSAIWQKDKKEHKLYLPAGQKWVDAWDKTNIIEGGQYITIETPLHKIPIFVKEGSEVDLGDLEGLYQESLDIASEKPDLAKLQEKAFGKN